MAVIVIVVISSDFGETFYNLYVNEFKFNQMPHYNAVN